jgi:hypothetical protein
LRRPTPTRLLASWLACGAAAAAAIAWGFWYEAGLTLSHYDAKAHLVVARRVIDNLTPGWQQIGAVWLPLPHLINLLPTQIDLFYRTGIFASGLSVACFGATVWASTRLIAGATGSVPGMITAALLFALNPNLLYLHSTPMTEPLLIAVTFTLVWWLYEWLADDPDRPIPRRLDVILFAAAWTRYEAWLIIAASIVLTAIVRLRQRQSTGRVIAGTLRLAMWPVIAILLFVADSRITVGSWFVSSGFFVPDPTYQGLVGKSAIAIWWGTHRLSGYVLTTIALLAAVMVAVRGRALLIALSLVATAALPFSAFVAGHPFRIRYMIPLVAASALFAGLGVGLLDAWTRASRGPEAASRQPRGLARLARRRSAVIGLAVLLVLSTVVESPPWSGSRAPVIEEAEWDVPVSIERRAVTACLAPAYHGEKVLASMGSLAHYMQELSSEGFALRDFVNEGNGTLWDIAMSTGPAPYVGWMLVEEHAEGGDVLAQRIRRDPSFARGMARVCEGGGVALYRRTATP